MKQVPHAIGNGTTTRSPFFTFFTPRPTSTISPMNSCPSMSPLSIVGTKPSYRWRSDPQMAVEVIFTITSLWLRIFGSGTVSTLTFSLPIQQFAFICFPFFAIRTRQFAGLHPPLGTVAADGRRAYRDEYLSQTWLFHPFRVTA